MAPRLFLLQRSENISRRGKGSEVLLETPQWLDVARAAGGRVASVYLLH